MSKLLKDLYNPRMIDLLCFEVKRVYSAFNSKNFVKTIFDDAWESRELKERMRHISSTLYNFLPQEYSKAIKILKAVAVKFSSFEYMFFQDYVEVYGLDDYKISIDAMEHFTRFASAEFAVRQFILKYPKKMMEQMELWAQSDNYHVRRLATEGCRPRLPWAVALPEFKKDPSPVLKILKLLKDDESEYVRRSVANNLNDISKDNPQIVIDIAKLWIGKNQNRDKLIKHACRTLLKQGNQQVLKLFGYTETSHLKLSDFKISKSVEFGQALDFSFKLKTKDTKLGKLRIEYGIDFMKSNGKQSRKIFKISESDFQEQSKEVNKKHTIRPISTRKYYPGKHGLTIIINGQVMIEGNFSLVK